MPSWNLIASKGDIGFGGSVGKELGYAESVLAYSTTVVSPAVPIPGLVISIDVGDKPIFVYAHGRLYNNTTSKGSILSLYEDYNLPGQLVVSSATPSYPVANVPQGFTLVARRRPSPGVHTYRLAYQVFGGGTSFADGTPPGGPMVIGAWEIS